MHQIYSGTGIGTYQLITVSEYWTSIAGTGKYGTDCLQPGAQEANFC